MKKQKFSKKPLKYSEQLALLESRGLIISNTEKAMHILESIGYYRLSGYWYPLLENKEKHIFKENANLDTAFNLYCFDRELRRLISSELEKIEIAVRSKIIYVYSHKYGALWFLDESNFSDCKKHRDSIDKIKKELKRSDEKFIKEFYKKYIDKFPPSWISLEVISFGTLSMLYHNLLPRKEKREVANYFGVSDSVFQNWLHNLTYLRNLCAHHARLWNRSLSIKPQQPKKTYKQWVDISSEFDNNRIYLMLCIIKYLLQTINPNSTFPLKLKVLLKKYPNVDLKVMNFPENWENDQFWNV